MRRIHSQKERKPKSKRRKLKRNSQWFQVNQGSGDQVDQNLKVFPNLKYKIKKKLKNQQKIKRSKPNQSLK